MTEDEINIKVKEWLIANGYMYKGVCNPSPKLISKRQKAIHKTTQSGGSTNNNHLDGIILKNIGYGQVCVPDGTRSVLIDHTGHKDHPTIDLIWIEAKGSDVGMSKLLEGFSRMAYAVYHGGGRGLLACPTAEFELLFSQKLFLRAIGVASERSLGLFDGEAGRTEWIC
jgi:hypothetical protein